MQVKEFLEKHFPELRGNISGGNYPPPEWTATAQKAISLLHILTIAAIAFGDSFWSIVPFFNGPPRWYQTCKEYPMQTFVGIFFIIPTFVQAFVTTGAFEISLNGEVLFSKIELGRFPNGQDLIGMFQTAGLILGD